MFVRHYNKKALISESIVLQWNNKWWRTLILSLCISMACLLRTFCFPSITWWSLCFQCIFLVWCMAPTSYNGSQIIYYRFIRPFILRYEKKIDSAVDRASEAAREGKGGDRVGVNVLCLVHMISVFLSSWDTLFTVHLNVFYVIAAYQ